MWTVEFADACTAQARNMHWRVVGAICAGVIQFAQSGQGRIEWCTRDCIRLKAHGGIADIRVNRKERRLLVIRLLADS